MVLQQQFLETNSDPEEEAEVTPEAPEAPEEPAEPLPQELVSLLP